MLPWRGVWSARSQVDPFLMLGASECLIFMKWILAVLFLLQTYYFCIGVNKRLSWGLYLETDNPIHCNAHNNAVYCIPLYCMFLPILQSDYFLWIQYINHFWKWDLSLIKKVCHLNLLQCGVLYFRYFYLTDQADVGRISGIYFYSLFLLFFCFVLKQ